MAKGFFYDDEDESNDKPPLHSRPIRAEDYDHESAAGVIPPYSFAHADSFDTRSYVASLFKMPLFGAPQSDGAQDHSTLPVDSSRPRSWKLPGTGFVLPTIPGADTAANDGRWTSLGDGAAARARHAEPAIGKPKEPPPPINLPPLRTAADAPDIPSPSPAPSLDPGAEAIATATGINRDLVGAAFNLAKTWLGNLMQRNAGTRSPDDARAEPAQHKNPDPPPSDDDQTEPTARQRLDSLRTRIDAEADGLDGDYDPKQRPPRRSRIKRAFVLLKHVDDPAFDGLAREFGYDPVRLRAVARLSSAKPGDHRTLMEELYQGLADETGRVKDLGFWILYDAHAQGLIGTQERPAHAAPSDDDRTATILQLLGHDLSSRVRGELTDDIDVNRPVMPQMVGRIMGTPTSRRAGSLPEAMHVSRQIDRAKRAATLEQNKKNGTASENEVGDWLQGSLKNYTVIVEPHKTEKTSKGRTRPDFRIREEGADKRLKSIEVKDGDARWRSPQREKQQEIEASLARTG